MPSQSAKVEGELNSQGRHTNVSALAFLLENGYCKQQYEAIIQDTKALNYDIYPCYKLVQNEKLKCYPKNYEKKNEYEICVKLQDLLNKSGERLYEAVALNWPDYILRNLELRASIGFDSSSGHTNPQQRYEDEEYQNKSAQQSLFVTCMGIIQLRDSRNNQCSWLNPTPMSVRFFRPLRLSYEKETSQNINNEYDRICKEIKFLTSHSFNLQAAGITTLVVFESGQHH